MLIFRTDPSVETGVGHLKRSVYLASLLKKKIDILFCIPKDKVVSRLLEERNIPYCMLKELNVIKQESSKIKSIVFDLRKFSSMDIEWLKQAKERNITTIQITDLGMNQQPVDYTIDASIEQLFPFDEKKQVLIGPDYTLLHHKFRHFNKVRRKYRRRVRNIFVSLGGSVQYRQLRKVVDLLSRFRFNVKAAPGFYLKKSGRKILKRLYPGLRFVGKTDNLARAFFEADVAFITTGMAVAEAAAVGTPCLYFHNNEREKGIAKSFENQGVGLDISHIDNLPEGDIIEIIHSLTVEKRIEMGNKGKKLVDGNGARRIVDFFERKEII
jgi:spore coat polysaccharide biosynthesis predicted glycosyltransferase SpsG